MKEIFTDLSPILIKSRQAGLSASEWIELQGQTEKTNLSLPPKPGSCSPDFDISALGWCVSKAIYDLDSAPNVIPLQGNWYVPSFDNKSPISTWVGYMISYVHPKVRAMNYGKFSRKNVQTSIRLTFGGPDSEGLARQCLWWPDRVDIDELFGRYDAQIEQDSIRLSSLIYKQEALNSERIWVVTMRTMNWIYIENNNDYGKWVEKHNHGGE